ncbi:MAG: MFS transporter [Liquorilactobacillus nagelii]|uniref:MFS transporter n=1 Tax=Liquorilactobacillus nagelii TaxID=82688 RepID=UPI00242FDD26|nr:MFS transporter [Liquorilactobacillus nagelii]MCI1633963.1 MFS transporter [Liquorilactobacillus nagelii]
MAPGALVGALLTPFGGILLDHLGAKRPVICGISLQFTAVLLLSLFFSHLNVLIITLIFVIAATGQSLSMPGIMTHGLQQLPVKLQADGNALFNTFQQFAGAAGTAIISTIVVASKQRSN